MTAGEEATVAKVEVVEVNVPFLSLVVLTFKVAVAVVPAAFVLAAIYVAFTHLP